MSSSAKHDTRTVQQIEKDTADRIEAAMLCQRIQQAAEWRNASRAGAPTVTPTKILTQN